MRPYLLLLLLAAAPAVCSPRPTAAPSASLATAPVSHAAFDQLLKKYVNSNGLVNYQAWKNDQQGLNQYLEQLSHNPPTADWSTNEQLAYWINAYNAYTIRLILDHYPVVSIKDIGSKIQIPLVTTPWAAKFFSIGGQKMSLDNIEHDVLRKKFNEPRIHFALVCASLSCPRLRPEAYTAARLSAQLDAQGRDFLRDPTKNQVGRTSAQLSRYFDWYKGDWEKNGQSVAKWVNRYAATPLGTNARISYLDYNWKLNEQ